MKIKIITWNPSPMLRAKAIKVNELFNVGFTYRKIAQIPDFKYSKRYLQELHYLGKELAKTKEPDEVDPSYPPNLEDEFN